MSDEKGPKGNPFLPDTSKPAEPVYRPFPPRPPQPPVTEDDDE